MNKSFFIFSASLLSAFAFAVPLRFDAPADSTKTFQASAYHGETLEIEAQLTWRNAPLSIQGDASATMLWQTNGMNDVWWSVPASVTHAGLVSATWSPTNDVGADLYRVFILVSGEGGASYRANLMLRLLGSPGASPNSLPLPTPFIDFAKVVVTNAPWGEGGGTDGQAVTNIVEGIVADATNAIPRGVSIDLRGDGTDVVTNAALSGTAYTEWNDYGGLPDGHPKYGLSLLFDEIAQHEAFSTRYPEKTSLGTAAYKDASEFATKADEQLVYQLVTNRLTGVTFDFATVAGLYLAISNIVAAQGGAITNFPAIP